MKIHLTFILSFFTIFIFGQNFPENKYNLNTPEYSTKVDAFLGLYYNNSTFVNTSFSNNLKNNEIEKDIGYGVKVAYAYKAILVDVDYFNSKFNVSQDLLNSNDMSEYDSSKTAFKHLGFNFTISYNIMLVRNNWLRDHVKSYIGLGYQLANLSMFTEINDTNNYQKDKNISNTKVNAPIWKAGIYLKAHETYGFITEYKQTLNINDEINKNYMISAGLIIRTPY